MTIPTQVWGPVGILRRCTDTNSEGGHDGRPATPILRAATVAAPKPNSEGGHVAAPPARNPQASSGRSGRRKDNRTDTNSEGGHDGRPDTNSEGGHDGRPDTNSEGGHDGRPDSPILKAATMAAPPARNPQS